MNTFVDNLLEKRRELIEKLAHIDDLLRLEGHNLHVTEHDLRPQVNQNASVTAGAEILDTVQSVLQQHEAPVPTSKLLHMLEIKGIKLGGTNPVANLSARLSRDSRFESAGRAGWVFLDSVDESESLDSEVLKTHVKEFYYEMDSKSLDELARHIEKRPHGLPRDVDQDMLLFLRRKILRLLTDSEKEQARKSLRRFSIETFT
ncbi:MAG: hypothetical protein AAFX07_11235 [Pseudomonadota bacterium]